ncbi:MAG: hypothetical protein GY773_31055, partial [Actinomycetia bacterium]|nr:hypothetical protein [Actinomycetes bacterium]
MGSAALPHLRLLGVLVGGLLTAVAISLAIVHWSGDEPSGPGPDGVTTMAIELEAGHRNPNDLEAEGASVAIPEHSGALVIAAEVGDRFAVRLDDESTRESWIILEHQLDEGPDRTEDERRATGEPWGEGHEQTRLALPPLLIDPTANEVEVVRLSGDGGDPVLFFLPIDPPTETRPEVAGRRQLADGAQVSGQGQPAIMARASWTDRGWTGANAGCSDGPWYADNVQAFVVHHTVSGNNYDAGRVDDMLRAILYSHVDINGWCDIGYNFVVDRFGTIWEGRSGGIDQPVIGGHAKGFNTSAVGVALLGQHQTGARPTAGRPTLLAESAISSLATWKLGRHGVDPHGTTWLKNRSTKGAQRHESGVWHLVPTVMGHRDLGLTSCPGSLAVGFVRDLGRRVTVGGVETVPYRFESWRPHAHGPGFAMMAADGSLTVAGSAAVEGMGLPPASDPETQPLPLPSPEAIAVAARPGSPGPGIDGYALHRDGVVRPFGLAPAVAERPAGDRPVVDIATTDAGGGWVLTADGAVIGFGGQPDRLVVAPGPGSTSAVVRGDLNRLGNGYLVEATGQLWAVGDAPPHQIGPLATNAVDV